MKKITKKIGITLVCTTLLGGVVVSTTIPTVKTIAYAEDTIAKARTILVQYAYEDETGWHGLTEDETYSLNPGESITINAKRFDGFNYTGTNHGDIGSTITYSYDGVPYGGFLVFIYQKTTEKPQTPSTTEEQKTPPTTEEQKTPPTTEEQKSGTSQPKTPQQDTSKSETSTTESSKTKAPTTETSTTEASKTEAPTTEAPTTEASKTSQESKKILPKTGQASSLLGVVGMSVLTCLGLLGLAKTKRRS